MSRSFSRFRLPVKYEELFGEPHSVHDFRQLTESLPRDQSSRFLAALGVQLHLPKSEQDFVRVPPTFIRPRSVVSKLLKICRKEGNRTWLHAGTLSAGWRALALWGSRKPGVADEAFLRDFTRWVFHLSDAYADRQMNLFRDEHGVECYNDLHVVAFTLQNEWIHGVTEDYNTIARTYALLLKVPRFLPPANQRMNLEQVFEEAFGFGLQQYLVLSKYSLVLATARMYSVVHEHTQTVAPHLAATPAA